MLYPYFWCIQNGTPLPAWHWLLLDICCFKYTLQPLITFRVGCSIVWNKKNELETDFMLIVFMATFFVSSRDIVPNVPEYLVSDKWRILCITKSAGSDGKHSSIFLFDSILIYCAFLTGVLLKQLDLVNPTALWACLALANAFFRTCDLGYHLTLMDIVLIFVPKNVLWIYCTPHDVIINTKN